ncbi:hypothetical protein F7734_44185 [Scytonema sp. UIC 10036]|uniref:hypothetical protein n=1 Tax=Scytonema sp. UIC 10036 TaxID=2304196 RepID=UPI0012DA83E7|nr:hypothetical protein [Scytonema sp. UIC 10036]MUG98926.1 hypothetical protein [Scytonema sp. UIC 10036]
MSRTPQTRVVLDPRYKDKVEQICKATGIHSPSQLFTILVANYGDVLVKSLKSIDTGTPQK